MNKEVRHDYEGTSGTNTVLIVLLIIIVLVGGFLLFGSDTDVNDTADTIENDEASVNVDLPDITENTEGDPAE